MANKPHVGFICDPEMQRALQAAAARRGRSVAGLVKFIIAAWLAQKEKTDG